MTHPRHIKIRGGLDLPIAGAPRQEIGASPAVSSVAVFVRDYADVRPALRVDVGDDVRAGQVLFVDRRRPAIAVTAPLAGTVREVHRGPGRRLQALVIQSEAASDPPTTTASEPTLVPVPSTSRDEVQQALLRYGLWPAFVARPYGDIPEPGAVPDDILVTAIDTNPLAPEPRVVIAAHRDAFLRGVEVLGSLTDGRVLVCQGPGPALVEGAVIFEGRHPAGLAGTHIHHLTTLGRDGVGGQVWHLSYQDTIAIGHLFSTGRLWTERVISLAGPAVREPRLMCVPLGAEIAALTDAELTRSNTLVLSGSVLNGDERAFLGRRHLQVTALDAVARSEPGPVVPTTKLERVAPINQAPTVLLRALSVGDERTAQSLGALALVEEDVAVLSYACPSGADYGRLLRNVLEKSRGRELAPSPDSGAGAAAPYVRAWRGQRQILRSYTLALLAPLGFLVYRDGGARLATLALALAAVLVWQLVFATLRKRALGFDGVITAITLAVLLPQSAPSWQVVLGASFGTVLAQQVFGGYGYGFVNPVVAALAFLSFSFTGGSYGEPVALHWLAVVPALLVLLLANLLAWRVLAGVAVGVGGIALAAGGMGWPGNEALGTLLFAVVFLAGDAVTASATNPGRWVYGLLVGTLLGLSLTRGDTSAILAILVGQIFAPLIDQAVVHLGTRFGRLRHA